MRPGNQPNASIEAFEQPEAADLLNVSRSNVQRARKVLDNGTPELIAAVEQGKIAVSLKQNATKILAGKISCRLNLLP